jgi:hypothetical protein
MEYKTPILFSIQKVIRASHNGFTTDSLYWLILLWNGLVTAFSRGPPS